MENGSAWIISEDARFTSELEDLLEKQLGCHVAASRPEECRQDGVPCHQPQWIFLDLRAPTMWDQLPQLRHVWRKVPNISSSSFIGIVDQGVATEQAVLADQSLAASLAWPFPQNSPPALAQVLRTATASQRVRQVEQQGEFRRLDGKTCSFLTYTPSLFPVLDDLAIAAEHDVTVLLIGETGTGKTTLAKIIHELSPRSQNRFLTVACGALSNELVDSELFGHVKGAFTSADRTKEGKFAAADGGTILLDEIDVLSLMQQAKLLRVLESGEYEPVGSNDTVKSNARTVVASNVSLESLVSQNRFRADLFYRLDQVKFELPPLRARPRDIIPLTINVIEECCRESNRKFPRIHPDFMELLKCYSWPGNIRELRNEVRRAVLFCREGVVTPRQLTPNLVKEAQKRRDQEHFPTARNELANEVAQTEQHVIEQILRAHGFNRAATARALGISRVTLYNKMRKYSIRINSSDSPSSDD